MHRRIAGLTLAVALAALSLATAHADPTRSPRAQFIGPLDCDNGMALELVSPSIPTPAAQVIGTNQVLIVSRATDVGTAPDGTIVYNDEMTYGSWHGKARGVDDQISCVARYQFFDPAIGLIDGVFTVTGILTPRS